MGLNYNTGIGFPLNGHEPHPAKDNAMATDTKKNGNTRKVLVHFVLQCMVDASTGPTRVFLRQFFYTWQIVRDHRFVQGGDKTIE